MYEKFLQQASKTELLSFFRRYESSMNKRKKYKSPKEFYHEDFTKVTKQVGENKKKEVIREPIDKDALKEVRK